MPKLENDQAILAWRQLAMVSAPLSPSETNSFSSIDDRKFSQDPGNQSSVIPNLAMGLGFHATRRSDPDQTWFGPHLEIMNEAWLKYQAEPEIESICVYLYGN